MYIKKYLNKCVINLIFKTNVPFGSHHINQYDIIMMRKENITIGASNILYLVG